MNKLFFLCLGLLLMISCDEGPEIRFEMAYERDFTIPAGLNNFETHYFYLRDIPIGTYLSSNGVTAEELISINPGSARLSTIFSGLGNYSIIRDVSIQIFTDDESLASEAFWRSTVPDNTGEDLDVIPTLIDAKRFLGGDRFNLFVKINLKGVPPQSLETKLRFSFLAK